VMLVIVQLDAIRTLIRSDRSDLMVDELRETRKAVQKVVRMEEVVREVRALRTAMDERWKKEDEPKISEPDDED
jgi:hypothetical protein